MGRIGLIRRAALRVCGAAAVGLLAACMAPGPAHAAPKLSVTKARLEVGPVTAGETIEAEFPLVNSGTDPLKIDEVVVTCGCTTTSYPQTLGPGEKGALKVKLVSSPLWNGAVEKQVTLKSNDPDRPALAVALVAEMRPLVQFEPQNPASINYKKGEVIRQVFTITPAAGEAVRIKGVLPAGPQTEARLLPPESSDKPGTARVEVTVRPPEQGGDFSTSVTLQTTHPRVPDIPLVVMAVSQDAITVSPSFLYLGNVRTTPGSGERILVLFKRNGTFRVRGVRTDSPALTAEIRPLDNRAPDRSDSYHEIAVRYTGGWAKGETSGKIVVTTDDPLSPTLEVRYQARVE